MRKSEILILTFAGILMAVGAVLSWTKPDFFIDSYVVEDGAIEWLTVVALVFSAGLMLWRAKRLKEPEAEPRTRLFFVTTIFAAVLFLFGAGEEISWGQRIFNVETPEWLEEKNRQDEMNLHNLEINGINLNKLIFTYGLAAGLAVYLLVIPFWYRKLPKFAAFVDRAGIPLPQTPYIFIWLFALLFTELVVTTIKRSELTEFALVFVLTAQLIRPYNGWIYEPKKSLG